MKLASLLFPFLFPACAPVTTPPPPENGHKSRIIHHEATKAIPEWSEEILTSEKSMHDDLVAPDGSVVPGVPRDCPTVTVNGVPLK